MNIRILNSRDAAFPQQFKDLLSLERVSDETVKSRVAEIVQTVQRDQDQALLRYSAELDHYPVKTMEELRISPETLQKAWEGLEKNTQQALRIARDNIMEYAQMQKIMPWSYTRADGSILSQQVQPLDSVGIYIPGGKASYPSSVLMNAIPAKVAGVSRVVMVVPTPSGMTNPLVLAAAHLCQVDEVWAIGGAQAIAALAYGTESIAAVDKITGPGNRYVAEAKRYVFGQVGIDMVAGPSEVVLIADEKARPDWIVADMFAQAEHDEMAQAILLTPSQYLLERVQKTIAQLLAQQKRAEIIQKSLENRGALILCRDTNEAVQLANDIAPEHLELLMENAQDYCAAIKHAGGIFVGEHSNEVFGDYCAGTNHVLPTARTARFASSLGVYDFQKRSSVLQLSEKAAHALSPIAQHLAEGEGLFAHALSAQLRGKNET